MPNRLANETSPYLLQHKDNPVDWYPWGEEALQRARDEDRPIFLSIGYSACHWCHVMEHESFENADTANLMNDLYVNIKVDREERPDIDGIYMQAVQAMTGHGGWPMSMFLTPDGRPFYAGTYFPPEDRHNLPAFPRILEAVAEAYRERRDEVEQSTREIVERLGAASAPRDGAAPFSMAVLDTAYANLAATFDAELGGIGQAPKFPQPLTVEFVLRHWSRTDDRGARDHLDLTLHRMALGGMYDQLGGGFHRYSVDRLWLVPHFEKMLYDNALLASAYLHAHQATAIPFYRQVVEETLAWAEREMRHPRGGFYSSQDADSEGVEGKFFVWTPAEIDAVLGEEAGRIARSYWAASDEGNFEGKNILWCPNPASAVAEELGIALDTLVQTISEARPKLLAAREQRIHPGLDDKVLVSWNALMLKAFAEAGGVFDEPRYVEIASQTATFLLENLRSPEGRLLRTWKDVDGGSARLNAYLEDYAMLADGLLALYEATFEHRWLEEAQSLADEMIELFWDAEGGLFYDTGSDHEQLVVRPRDIFDNAIPCGGSVAAYVLLRLAVFTGRASYESRAVASLHTVAPYLAQAPSGFANWLQALAFHLETPKEVVILGPGDSEDTRELARTARTAWLPHRVLAGAAGPSEAPDSPLFEGRTLTDGAPTAYVCENYACKQPVTSVDDLIAQLTDFA